MPSASPPSHDTVAVIGAGIVGSCIALRLQRAGCQVTLFDPEPPGSGASSGNAGLISVDSCIPIALPGMVWQVPGWLLDPAGPLAVRPAHVPTAFPWLLRWLWASRPEQVRTSAAALHALHHGAIDEYRELLGQAHLDQLIRLSGQLHIWQRPGGNSRADRLVASIRTRHQVQTRTLDAGQIRSLLPGLADGAVHGIRFPRNGFAPHPQRLVQQLARLAQDAGTRFVQRAVLAIEPGQRQLVHLDGARHAFDQVVVATGAYSRRLLQPLGVRLPLETERGYHVELPHAVHALTQPFIHKELAVAVTPMATGLRFAGTVEIAGLERPANPRRTDRLLEVARKLFPGINTQEARTWLGFRPSTPDSLPIIDRHPRYAGITIACGHGHTGMTGAPATARRVAALVTHVGARDAGDNPYSLSRFSRLM